MRRFFMLMVLLAGCAPTRPYTAEERAERWELPPPREPPLKQLELQRQTESMTQPPHYRNGP